MSGRKVELEYITSDSKRKTTFRKRKHGIFKKINELTTLCGIDACAIIYEENNPEATVYPSEDGVQMVLDNFRSFPDSEQRKGMIDHEGFMRKSIKKVREKLEIQNDKFKKRELNNQIHHFIQTGEFDGNVSESDLEDLSSFIDINTKEVEQRIKLIQDLEDSN